MDNKPSRWTKNSSIFFKKLLREKNRPDLGRRRSHRKHRAQRRPRNGLRGSRSTYSLHMADHGTDAMEREKSLLLAQRGGDYIDYLKEALQRIEDGTFGICRTCKGPIGRAAPRGRAPPLPSALAASPSARRSRT